ncbi:12384_t:CDS:2 [Ambispora leptoticha]|uniref:DNA-directed RNA polymerase III subunit n=1 Tax=Ambispora leptoticha TaxID=144679 RepID=A0A9N9DAE9_9GLOM|nr:12384_t:CDS:2 [Ambispora leptoticha]
MHPSSRGRGGGRGSFRRGGRGGRGGVSGRGRRTPGPLDGVSWSELQKMYTPEGPIDAFPERELASIKRPNEDEEEMMKFLFDFKAALKDTAYYCSTQKPKPVLQRYRDEIRPQKSKPSLRDIQTELEFFPEELHGVIDPSKIFTAEARRKKARVDINTKLDELLVAESKEKPPNYFDNGEVDDPLLGDEEGNGG